MTYIGAWFNGLTLMILGLVSMFSLPKITKFTRSKLTPTWLLHRIKSRASWLRFTLRSPSARKISKFVVFIPSKCQLEDLNGKKEQNGYHQTQNPSKARQLKQTKDQTNNPLYEEQYHTTTTTTTTDLPR